jgi:hypothetical protein
MKKPVNKKSSKKKVSKYEEKLKIKGSFDKLLKKALRPKK